MNRQENNSNHSSRLSKKSLKEKIKSLPISLKITLLVTIFPGIVTLFTGFYLTNLGDRHMKSSLLNQGRTLFNQLEVMRHWNANYGGVYVLKKPGMETNKYLYEVGPGHNKPSKVEPEIKDIKGRTYTLKNPALMTHELSELTEKESKIRFKITSRKYINPENKPDEFEEEILKDFENDKKLKEYSRFEDIKSKPFYRYIAPLKTKEACLACHGFQGYKIGDIRGGISVMIPIEDELQARNESKMRIVLLGSLVYLFIVFTLMTSLRYLITEPLRKLKEYTFHMGEHGKGYESNLPNRLDEIGTLTDALISANHELTRQQADLEEKAAHLDHKTRIDPLTDVFNRHHFVTEMPGLLERVKNEKFVISLLMIDLDHFKKVNDDFGHVVGDMVLRSISRRLQHNCRSEDMVIRFGGEEFVIVLPGLDIEKAGDIAERIRVKIEESPIRIRKKGNINCTISIGISSTEEHDTAEGLLLCADKAMYRAKKEGRNRVEVGC